MRSIAGWTGNIPDSPFDRYADDIVVHCNTEDQARSLLAATCRAARGLGLELHPDKTKIVYCKDTKRRGTSQHTSFDFLGYTFRARRVNGRNGLFMGFLPAMSKSAKKGDRPRDQGMAPQPSQRHGPVRSRLGDQRPGPGLDQLLRGLLPLRVVLPGKAHRRAPRPVGHAEVQTTARESRNSHGLGCTLLVSASLACSLTGISSCRANNRPARAG